MTDPLGQSQVIPYLKELAKKNYKIDILSAEKSHNYQKRKKSIQTLLNNAGINWIKINYSKNPPVLSTVIDIFNLKRTAKKLARKNQYDIVHCRSYIAAFVGIYLQRKFKSKFLFDMRGFFPDERVDGKIWNIKNPLYNIIYKYFKKKEFDFLVKADYTVSLTNAGKSIICERPGLENIPIEVIPCCADLNLFDYEKVEATETEKYRRKFNISKENFVLTYLGSLGTWYLADEMMQFFNALKEKIKSAKFLIITQENEEILLKHAKKNNISLIDIIITKAERHEIPTMLSLSNASVFFIKPVFSKKASSPTKLAELLGMGIPVVCNEGVGDLQEIYSENNIGKIIKNFTEEDFNSAIDYFFDEGNNISKRKLREIAINNFSLEEGVNRYAKVYNKLIDK